MSFTAFFQKQRLDLTIICIKSEPQTKMHYRRLQARPTTGGTDYLYVSSNNIFDKKGYTSSSNVVTSGCSWSTTPTLRNVDPLFRMTPVDADENLKMVDPRPETTGPAYSDIDDVSFDTFFTKTNYKGAFGTDLWLSGLSILDVEKKLPRNTWGIVKKGAITADETWVNGNTYMLTGQVFVKSGAT